MLSAPFAVGDSLVHRLDPRVRVVAAAAFAIVVALLRAATPAAFALAVAAASLCAARLAWRPLLARFARLNAFLVLLGLMLAASAPGNTLFTLGPIGFTDAGAGLALLILLKTNAIVAALTALLATMDATALGHALWRLRVPSKLTYLFLFTVRYLDVLHREYSRLRAALTARAFQARCNRHTLRTLGYLVGMLLVRAFDRSQRVHEAMLCRGFAGKFPVMAVYRAGVRDVVFACCWGLAVVLLLAWR
ncbi:MAG: cobalt ECF transporter T component CbiQ [Candidatus Hydrogenedentes bacterium]|nr:cobalt ECF transporter T component CbiQ [Candidatus Hydrogenedentota bacterium]